MENPDIYLVIIVLTGMFLALIRDKWRPGLILFSVIVIFMCTGILSPSEMLEGFSNKGMITIALLFLISEGIRQTGVLENIFHKILPTHPTSIARTQIRILPVISFISAFLNNTPTVVILSPVIKRWCLRMNLPPTKFLIPLCYATTLGGLCTLIGTSTNLVVHGMMLEAGFNGFSMFELGKIGVIITVFGLIYLFFFSHKLLPQSRPDIPDTDTYQTTSHHTVEVILRPRFPGINQKMDEFDFFRHYGAEIREIRRGGYTISKEDKKYFFREGDTLFLTTDKSFESTWRTSSVFLIVANHSEIPSPVSPLKQKLALGLLFFMITGATIGELPITKKYIPELHLDMFFFVCITTVIMAFTQLFPPRKYTKYISWDILITIACAFGISKAIVNSGLADNMASFIISISEQMGAHAILAILFLITNIFTQLITNNASAALCFPIALAVSNKLGVNPMPFFVTICVAASTSFITPIAYQSNLIVQGIGNYKFTDFVRSGLPLNILIFILSIIFIPFFWKF